MSVRERLEQEEMARRYAARESKPTPEQVEQQRAEKLQQNAEKIRSEQVTRFLLDLSPDEEHVVLAIIGRERPESLGNADVLAMEVERVRAVGTENLRKVMEGTTRKEQAAVWEILKQGDAFARTGMDGGAACRAALRQVQEL